MCRIYSRTCLALVVVLFVTTCAGMGRSIYVDTDATGANDGSSWADAYNYLRDGLTAALFSSIRPIEIRIAQGIYKPDERIGITSGDREATFQLINWVTIMGGYAGFGEPDPNARDIHAHETILSGDLAGDDGEVSDPCDLLAHPSRAENSYNVVTGSGVNETTVLDGFTITAGNDDRYETSGRTNFAIGCGGGMYNQSGSPTVINCTFRGNSSNDKGGGMGNKDGSSPRIINCTFSDNFAVFGGAISNADSNPTLVSCTLVGNNAGLFGGGMYDGDSSPRLTACTFIGNRAVRGGGMYADSGSDSSLTCCNFSRNRATAGGGVCCERSSPILTNCIFSGNRAEHPSGGSPPPSSGHGAAVFCAAGNPTVANCTFCGNYADEPSVFCNVGGNATLTNCILWDGGAEILDAPGTTTVVTFSDVQGGWPGAGNIDADPCFAEAGYWADVNDPNVVVQPNDPNAVWIDGEYHLKSQAGRWDPNERRWTKDDVTSPCVDAGNPMSAIGHEPFPNGGIINMGAYGGTVEASKSYFGQPVCETIVAGDINGDCKVNFKDFALAAAHWLEDHREYTYIQWLGHASVKIWSGDVVIYVDPRKVSDSPHDATLVLVTHTHGDHYSPADIAKVWGAETKLIAAGDVVAAEGKGQAIMPGQTIKSGSVSVTGVAAYNINKSYHPKAKNWVGFIIEIGAKRIYCAGDTDLTEEMKALTDIDVAILPVGGTYTMDADEAAEATEYLKPELAIPYHWGDIVGSLSDAQRFAELAHCNVKIMTVGESIRL